MRFILFFWLLGTPCLAQTGIYGKVVDGVTGNPLEGAHIAIQLEQLRGTQSDNTGAFMLEMEPGRYEVAVSFSGYKTQKTEVLVIAGKPTWLLVQLSPAITELQEVTITSVSVNPESPVDLSIPIEKTLRVPANFFDPSRMATSYPGIVASNDQANALIVNGLGPAGLSWRLNGLEIVNPNHLANAGTLADLPVSQGGGVNILSAQMLDRTEINTGYVAATQPGNVTSGIFDMKYRPGSATRNYTLQASLIGLDLAAEGRLGKKSTYLLNYRYSTLGLLSAIGIPLGDEKISFQDLSWNFDGTAGKRAKVQWSVFGFAGASRNTFDGKDSVDVAENKDLYSIRYKAFTYASGGNLTRVTGSGRWQVGLVASGSQQERNSTLSANWIAPAASLLRSEGFNQQRNLLSGRWSYRHVHGAHVLEVGTYLVHEQLEIDGAEALGNSQAGEEEFVNATLTTTQVQPFIGWQYKSGPFQLASGLRWNYYSASARGILEPALRLTWQRTMGTWALGWSSVSQQLPGVLRSFQPDLALIRSQKLQATYHFTGWGAQWRTEGYYQLLGDVPVSGSWSYMNWLEELPRDLTMSSNGKGRTYGLNLTAERNFQGNYYVLAGGSVYRSEYLQPGADWVQSRFNGGFTIQAVAGKEWAREVKTRGINLRALYLGGVSQPGIDAGTSALVGRTSYDYGLPMQQLGEYVRLDFRYSVRKNKPGYTRTLAVEIQNVLSISNDGWYYWDAYLGEVNLKKQLGIIPVLVYKVEF